jgi:excisionase family DNA binding protein
MDFSLEKFPEAMKVLLNRFDILDANLKSFQDSKEENQHLTVSDVCRLFQISKTTLYAWLDKGLLNRHKMEGVNRTYFKKSEIDALLITLKKYKHS